MSQTQKRRFEVQREPVVEEYQPPTLCSVTSCIKFARAGKNRCGRHGEGWER